MRILVVSAYGLPHIGGIEVAVHELATQLAGQGHGVTHLTSSAGGRNGVAEPGYRVLRVPALNAPERRLGVPFPLFGPQLVPTLRREMSRADVVHSHGFIYPGSAVAAFLARPGRTATPFVLTEHVGHVPYESRFLDAVEGAVIRKLGRRVLRAANTVVTYNDRVASQLRALCPSVETRTILNGVDQELFRPPEKGEREEIRAGLGWDRRPRILFVGRPVAKKGFALAVEAIESVEKPVALAVAGTETLPRGIPGQVEALGSLSRERLAEIYRAVDALIMPSRGEGFPLTAQEAMASGLPLLISDDPGYAPNLDGAGSGVAVIADGDFASALTRLLGDPAALAEARNAAVEHARRKFSWRQAALEHESLYEELRAART